MPAHIPNYVPPGGWSSSTFRGQEGRAMLEDWFRTDRRYRRAGIKVYMEVLEREHQVFFRNVIERAPSAHRKAAQTVTINPMGNPNAWAKIIEEEATKLGLSLTIQTTPIYEATSVGVYESLTAKLGGTPNTADIAKQKYQGKLLAQQVTGITHTTKLQMSKVIRDGIEEKLTVHEMVKRLREKYPTIASNRFPTIARTEMGRAADLGSKNALKNSTTVLECSVIGCEAIEPGSPTYHGTPTCNIQAVPVHDVDQLHFHINHTGAIVPSKFRDDKDILPKPGPSPEPEPIPVPSPPPPPPLPVAIDAAIARAATAAAAVRRLNAMHKTGELIDRPNIHGGTTLLTDPRKAHNLYRKVEAMPEDEWAALLVDIDGTFPGTSDWLPDVTDLEVRFFNSNFGFADHPKVKAMLDQYAMHGDGYLNTLGNIVAVKNSKGQYTIVSGHDQAALYSLLGKKPPVRVFNRKPVTLPTPPLAPVVAVPPVSAVSVLPLTPTNGSFPASLGDTEIVRKLGGSTGAVLVKDKFTGRLYVMKRGASSDHLEEEMLADSLYRAAGINVPAFQRYVDGGKPVKLAEFIDGDLLSELSAVNQKAAFKQMQEDFGFDTFMGNWDVGGTGLDNVLVDKSGKVWRIDNGGSLRFRAQGGHKTDKDWGVHGYDLWTMRAKGNVAEKIFGDMSWTDIEKSISKINFEQALKDLPKGEMRDLLTARATEWKRTARIAQGYRFGGYTNAYRDQQLKLGMDFRRNGLSEAAPKSMKKTTPSTYDNSFVDERGRPFGGLRGGVYSSGSSATPTPGAVLDPQDIFPALLAAVKSMKAHADAGDFAFNTNTAAVALSAYLKAPSHIKAHYSDAVEWLQKAEAASANKSSAFFAANPLVLDQAPLPAGATIPSKPSAATQPSKHIGEIFEATLLEAFGGNAAKAKQAQSAVASWQASQAGSSWGSQALAHSDFQARMTATPVKDIYVKGTTTLSSHFSNAASSAGLTKEELDLAYAVHHQLVQEVLEHTEFPGNDWNLGAVRLFRSVPSSEIGGSIPKIDTHVTADPKMRGPNVSGSVHTPVAPLGGSFVTEQAVPRGRVTGLYWLGQGGGRSSTGSFAGDSENEFTFFAPGVDMAYRGRLYVEVDASSAMVEWGKLAADAGTWKVPLTHLDRLAQRAKQLVVTTVKRLYVVFRT